MALAKAKEETKEGRDDSVRSPRRMGLNFCTLGVLNPFLLTLKLGVFIVYREFRMES